MESDSSVKAYVTISDWNILGITELPLKDGNRVFSTGSTVGAEIVLRYQDFPEGFKATVFDASGRKVDELHSAGSEGKLTWGKDFEPGVYFIRAESAGGRKAQKVVLVH